MQTNVVIENRSAVTSWGWGEGITKGSWGNLGGLFILIVVMTSCVSRSTPEVYFKYVLFTSIIIQWSYKKLIKKTVVKLTPWWEGGNLEVSLYNLRQSKFLYRQGKNLKFREKIFRNPRGDSLGVKIYMEEKMKRLVLEAGQSETTMGNNPEQLNRAPNPKWVHACWFTRQVLGRLQNYPRDFHIPQ